MFAACDHSASALRIAVSSFAELLFGVLNEKVAVTTSSTTGSKARPERICGSYAMFGDGRLLLNAERCQSGTALRRTSLRRRPAHREGTAWKCTRYRQVGRTLPVTPPHHPNQTMPPTIILNKKASSYMFPQPIVRFRDARRELGC